MQEEEEHDQKSKGVPKEDEEQNKLEDDANSYQPSALLSQKFNQSQAHRQ